MPSSTAYGDTLSPEQRRALDDIAACRTAALGGHVEECDHCGHQQIAYNSCRNRHCPKCQATAAAQWMEAREAELLPVEYFHVVFTLPAALGPIALQNPRSGLRPAVPGRRRDLAAGRRRSRAPRGRDRLPGRSPHLGPEPPTSPPRPLRRARRRALSRRLALGRLPTGFLPPGARPQPRLPRQVPRAAPGNAFDRGQLSFHGKLSPLADPGEFQRRLADSAQTEWVVYAKPPFGGLS